jgi:hypothetical protein
MGCWNGTCMISNLHVKSGQDVIVYMIAKNKDTDSYCYPNTVYNPCPIPFYGKYNDYGAVEDCHGVGLDLVVNSIRNQLYEFHQGPNSCHDCEVLKTNFDLEKLFEADHEGRLGIEDGHTWDGDDYDRGQLEKMRDDKGLTESQARELDRLANKLKKVDTFRPVTHVIIHGDVFKAITEKFYLEDYVGNGKGTSGWGNNYVKVTFQDVLNDISGYIESRKKEAENASEEDKWKRKYGMNDDYNNPNQVIRRIHWMTSNSSESRGLSIVSSHDIQEIIEDYVEKKEWDTLAAFVKELMVTSWIQTYMSSTRKHWHKTTGAGSQNDEHLGYQILAEATVDILKAEKAEYSDDEEFDDEDEEVSGDAPAEAE